MSSIPRTTVDAERGVGPARLMPAALAAGRSVKARVVLAKLDFTLRCPVQEGKKPGRHAATLHAFVDRVHEVAAATHAAVHSFVGDRLVATWNAAATTVQAEVKAGRFLSRLLQDAGDPAVKVYGIATSFHTRVHLAGKGKQSALLVGADPNEAAVAEATRIATTYRTIIVNGTFRRAADHAVVFRGVGITRKTSLVPTSDVGRPVSLPGAMPAGRDAAGSLGSSSDFECGPAMQGLFEVRGEHVENDEGWMYVIETQSTNSPDAQLCQAADFAVQGHKGVALTSISCMQFIVRTEPIINDFMSALRKMG
jgi:class 3 adenylate cyclase